MRKTPGEGEHQTITQRRGGVRDVCPPTTDFQVGYDGAIVQVYGTKKTASVHHSTIQLDS